MERNVNEDYLEELRNKAKIKTYIVYILSIISIPIYIWLFYIALKNTEDMYWFFIVKICLAAFALSILTLGLLWYLIVKSSYNKFNKSYKEKYVVKTISSIPGFDKLEYIQKDGFQWDEIRNSAVVACGDERHFKSEDLLLGQYKGATFKISDVITQKVIIRDRKSKIEEIFNGQIICFFQFDNIKISNGHLQIFEKNFFSDLRGWKAEHRIYTENEEFNKRFNIYASDEHNAYYILTPERIQKIMDFSYSIKEQISLVFYNNKLFIAVKRPSMFDVVVDESVLNQRKNIVEDVKIIQKAREMLII